MRKNIWTTSGLLFSLLTGLALSTDRFGAPITDDLSKLTLLKQNIPNDYEIPLHYIPREVSGRCWVVLNIYPLEQSLVELASMFGALSSNKEDIIVFITMLKSLRFTFDHEELETAMQVFQCHYEEGSFLSGLYFDYIKELLTSAAQGTEGFPCQPPPCLNPQQAPGTQEEWRGHVWSRRGPLLLLLLIPITACILLLVWLVKSRSPLPECDTEASVSDVGPTISIPLHTFASTSGSSPVEEPLPEHQRG